MADLAKSLETKHQLPVIEGVSSAVVLAESLVNLKIKTCKVGSYAVPRKKEYMGYLNNSNLREKWNESKNPKSSLNKSLHDYVKVKKHSKY